MTLLKIAKSFIGTKNIGKYFIINIMFPEIPLESITVKSLLSGELLWNAINSLKTIVL
tara:strand:- start:447 stop:620 length:174 start_codon:yes stop_codon:yes gene_type:complete